MDDIALPEGFYDFGGIILTEGLYDWGKRAVPLSKLYSGIYLPYNGGKARKTSVRVAG
jgi:hypothetical protein